MNESLGVKRGKEINCLIFSKFVWRDDFVLLTKELKILKLLCSQGWRSFSMAVGPPSNNKACSNEHWQRCCLRILRFPVAQKRM